jgi:hypothetical protein
MPGDSLDLYLAYRGFLTADQVAGALSAIDGIYDAFFYLEAPGQSGRIPPSASKLRVNRAETGQSISFEFVQGLQQVYDAVDPALRGVGGGIGMLGLTAATLTRVFRSGSRALAEHRSQDLQLEAIRNQVTDQSAVATIERQKRELELRDLANQVRMREAITDSVVDALTEHPPSAAQINMTNLIERLAPPISRGMQALDQDNIVKATVDGEVLIDRPDAEPAG